MSMRGKVLAKGKAKQATIRAVVTRADGRVEDLGVISYWHRNPLKRWAFALRQLVKRMKQHGRSGTE